MASTTFRFLKFWTARQIFFQILCSKKNFENFFWSDQKTGLTARQVHYGPFRSPRSISGPYQKMTSPLLNSPKSYPLLKEYGRVKNNGTQIYIYHDNPKNKSANGPGTIGLRSNFHQTEFRSFFIFFSHQLTYTYLLPLI